MEDFFCSICNDDLTNLNRGAIKMEIKSNEDNVFIISICSTCVPSAHTETSVRKVLNSNKEKLSPYLSSKESMRTFIDTYVETIRIAQKNMKGMDALGTKILGRNEQKKPLLEDLNEKVDHFGSVLFRDNEIDSLIRVLSRKNKNNPVIVGESGVGKTSLVEELTKLIVREEIDFLKGYKVKSFNPASFMAGTAFRGQFEEKFNELLEELKSEKTILFIDEIHQIIGLGASEGNKDNNLQNLLKPLLTSNDLMLIGATTPEEFRSVENDVAFSRRIQRISLNPLTKDQTKQVLREVKYDYIKHHKIDVPEDISDFIVEMSDEFINERNFPDKALDVLDESLSYARINRKDEIKEMQTALEEEKEFINFSKFYNDEIKDILNNKVLGNVIEKIVLSREEVRYVVEDISGIPSSAALTLENRNVIKDIKNKMTSRVKGQEEAVNKITKALQRKLVRLSGTTNKKPTVLFLAGPTGVGKTEVAKTISEVILGSEDELVRFDMSEFNESPSINRLIGSPPGYVGHENEGELTETIRQNPFSVILLDEFEKATPEISKLFLQLFDDGVLTDTKGRTVDFSNTIILLTSNIGSQTKEEQRISFQPIEKSKNTVENKLKKELNKVYSPEFLNRIDDFIVFEKLTQESLDSIAEDIIEELKSNAKELGIEFEITTPAIKFLSEKGYSEEYGARPLLRTIQSELEDLLIDYTLHNDIPNETIKINLKKDELIIKH